MYLFMNSLKNKLTKVMFLTKQIFFFLAASIMWSLQNGSQGNKEDAEKQK